MNFTGSSSIQHSGWSKTFVGIFEYNMINIYTIFITEINDSLRLMSFNSIFDFLVEIVTNIAEIKFWKTLLGFCFNQISSNFSIFNSKFIIRSFQKEKKNVSTKKKVFCSFFWA